MRFLHIAVFALLASMAIADPLIDIPTARKVPFGVFKVEFADAFSKNQTQLAYLDFGLTPTIEATLRTERVDGSRTNPTADLMYSIIAPLPGLSPGFSVGVQDIANTTADGRRAYLATTYREPLELGDAEIPMDLTFGTYYNARFNIFAGIALPVNQNTKLLLEDNAHRIAGGIEVAPTKGFAVRFLVRGRDTLADVVLTSHF